MAEEVGGYDQVYTGIDSAKTCEFSAGGKHRCVGV